MLLAEGYEGREYGYRARPYLVERYGSSPV